MLKFRSFMRARKILRIILLSPIFFVAPAFAQTDARQFVSMYGNFRIALPESPTLTRGVRNLEAPDKGAGMIYAWNGADIVFTVLYLDPLETNQTEPSVAEKAKALEENNRGVRETVKKYEGEIISEKPIVIGALEGTEIRANIASSLLVARNFQVGRRSYSIQAVINEPESEAEAMTAISSFRVFDGLAELKKIIDRMTPPLFTEKPRKLPRKSDAELMGLRGRVAAVNEETEDLTGDEFQQGRILSGSLGFDEKGLQTLEMTTTNRGMPIRVVALGYYRGGIAARIGRVEKTDRSAVDLKIFKIFDASGRLAETKYTDLKGKLKSTTRYVYKDRSVETTVTDEKGNAKAWKRETLDERGNVIETNFQQSNSNGPQNRSLFTYEDLDEFGNWTKRIEYEKRVANGKESLVPVKVTYRTVVYHSR